VLPSGKITNGSDLSFTTGALPSMLPPVHFFPPFTVNIPAGPNTGALRTRPVAGAPC
jgi:hypothetical protein